ncbi:hypothetical protein [Leifsonia sp. A12D58]|uniref:hypothetical protein n=1 Tax=Leifsonia sp. A12D58 TaxID=3397674 RepID=UPI0039DF4C37
MSTTTLPTPSPPARRLEFSGRYVVGLTLIVVGVALSNLMSTYTLMLLGIGPLVQLIGWLVMPGALWRRLLVLLPCLLAGLVLRAGPDFAGAFVVLLAGWLLVRHRPLHSYLTLALPFVASFALKAALDSYSMTWVMLLLGTLVTVGGAWAAWWLAETRRIPRKSVRTLR